MVVNEKVCRGIHKHTYKQTLIGTVEKGVVEVSNCFTVPHKESKDEVSGVGVMGGFWEGLKLLKPF